MPNSETNSIVELNKETEKYIQNASGITFVHASDMHAMPKLWDRMVEYVNYYSDKISFIVHTGDYCGGSQKVYADMYMGKKCLRPIYNCVGNHDCFGGGEVWGLAEKSTAHKLLFNHTEDWNAVFFDCEYSMSYYKDIDGIRLIVLDDYYDIWETRAWLRGILREALEKGLHVITAQHEPTGYINDTFRSRYQTYRDCNAEFRRYELERTRYDYDHRGRVLYGDVIEEFISLGGNYVINLAGHDHVDEFGLNDRGILNIVVENGTSWDGISDISRVPGERSEDCFNVMSVDTEKHEFTVVRIGANTDKSGRTKQMMVFDYQNKRILTEC